MTSLIPHTRNLLVLALAAAVLASCAAPQSPYTGAAGTESPQTRGGRDTERNYPRHSDASNSHRTSPIGLATR